MANLEGFPDTWKDIRGFRGYLELEYSKSWKIEKLEGWKIQCLSPEGAFIGNKAFLCWGISSALIIRTLHFILQTFLPKPKCPRPRPSLLRTSYFPLQTSLPTSYLALPTLYFLLYS